MLRHSARRQSSKAGVRGVSTPRPHDGIIGISESKQRERTASIFQTLASEAERTVPVKKKVEQAISAERKGSGSRDRQVLEAI